MNFNNWLKKLAGCKEEEYLIQIGNLQNNIDLLTEKVKEIQSQKNIIEPNTFGTASYSEVLNILNAHSDASYISDDYFNLTSIEEASKFVAETNIQYKEWEQNKFDCDNFSFALMGYWSKGLESFAFGIAWSKLHAFNFMIDNNKQLWVIEPQLNKWLKIEDIKSNPMYYPWRLALC
jgi:hypothetical protein